MVEVDGISGAALGIVTCRSASGEEKQRSRPWRMLMPEQQSTQARNTGSRMYTPTIAIFCPEEAPGPAQ